MILLPLSPSLAASGEPLLSRPHSAEDTEMLWRHQDRGQGSHAVNLGWSRVNLKLVPLGSLRCRLRECWVIQGHCTLPLGIWKAGPCLVTFLTLSLVVTLPTIDRRQKGGVLGRPNDGQPGISRVCSNLTVHMVYVV